MTTVLTSSYLPKDDKDGGSLQLQLKTANEVKNCSRSSLFGWQKEKQTIGSACLLYTLGDTSLFMPELRLLSRIPARRGLREQRVFVSIMDVSRPFFL